MDDRDEYWNVDGLGITVTSNAQEAQERAEENRQRLLAILAPQEELETTEDTNGSQGE